MYNDKLKRIREEMGNSLEFMADWVDYDEDELVAMADGVCEISDNEMNHLYSHYIRKGN